MQDTLQMLIIICPLVFLAGFIDSIAGGGGIISLPAYVFAGVPPHMSLGTNKFASTFGTIFSAARFVKNKKVHLRSAIVSVAAALVGSPIGVNLALALDEKYLRYIMIGLLPAIAFFILTKRNFGEKDTAVELSNRKMIVLSALSGLVIGAYDGFFGPGTGTFLILVYTGIIGFDLTMASGNAKVVNLASNLSALITFMISSKVLFLVGIPAALFSILGHWIGSGLAIRNGSKVIKPVFVAVLVLLLVKITSDIIIP
jgi:uncharacterized membrane protein YfcA